MIIRSKLCEIHSIMLGMYICVYVCMYVYIYLHIDIYTYVTYLNVTKIILIFILRHKKY